MRDFKIITGYELKQQLGKKSVRVTTIILMLAALIATSFPRISQMVKGDVTPRVPASILRTHPEVTVLLDRAAAARLS